MTTIDRIFTLLDSGEASQLTFAKTIGVSSGNVSDWKSGRSKPKIEAICKIADYFGVSTDYLLGRTDNPGMVPLKEKHSDLSTKEQMLLAAYRRADDHARDMVDLALKPFVDVSAPPTPIVRLAAHGGDGVHLKELTPEQTAAAQADAAEIEPE